MGEQRVSSLRSKKNMQAFVSSLLSDVQALELMLEQDMFEKGITRIGAEQEMVMVKSDNFKPATIAMEALARMKNYEWVETEIARFNLETNLTPAELKGSCFSKLEKENQNKLDLIQEKLDGLNTKYVLTGILPTLRKYHLHLKNLTPKKRYKALLDSIKAQQLGSSFELKLVGIDELLVKHDSALLEACNTSFQIHLQIEAKEFVQYYNIAQALAGPIMAISANSPLVFGKRLWHESRIALFQQSLDTRSTHEHMRERSARVTFGNDWIHDSILDIYKEDITRFRALISSDVKEDSLKTLKKGKVPKLRSLQVHNSTIYRWNRPCYGISENGMPHLRIENRVIPAGPTVIDEVANAMFWIGVMIHYGQTIKDIRKKLSFADVRDNFGKAARFGIDTQFNWFNDKKVGACDLVLKQLLPAARKGLESRKVSKRDINKYLGVIEGRAKSHMNGARWILRTYTQLRSKMSEDKALSILTSAMIDNQRKNKPVHTWPAINEEKYKNYNPSELLVADFMITDLFTVQKDDIIELVAKMMEWKGIQFTPVEDVKGNLMGLVTSAELIKNLIKQKRTKKTLTVKDIMIKDLEKVGPKTTIKKAMKIMRSCKIGCLPVVQGNELIGLITEKEFLDITGRIL